MAVAQVIAGARILISDLNAYYSLLKGSAGEAITLIYNAAGSVIFQPSSDPAATTQLVQIKNNAGTVKTAFTSGGGALFSSQVLNAKSSDIASSGTTDLSTATGNYVVVTGTTTITAFGTVQAGTVMVLEFSGALTITHNASSLILRAGANATTVAGDVYAFVSEGSGNWREVAHNTSTPTLSVTRNLFVGAASWGSVAGSATLGGATATNIFFIGWELDSGTTERIGTSFLLPADWASGVLTYKVHFMMETATSGNVVILTRAIGRATGESGDASPEITPQDTVAVPGSAETIKVQTISATHTVSAGDLIQMDFSRIGGDAGDTAAGDMCFLGLEVTYTATT